MKLSLAFVLLGVALATAIPLNPDKFELGRHVEELPSDKVFEAETESTLDEVKEQLKDRVKTILEKIKDVIKQGKLLHKETLEKLNDLKEKLHEEFGKEGLQKLKEKTRELFRKLFENLGVHKRSAEDHVEDLISASDEFDVVKIKEVLEDLIKKAKDAFENGKTMTEYFEKIQQIRDALKLLNIDLGDKTKEYLQVLKDKMKDYWNKLKEKFNSKRSADIDVFEMFENLKEMIREEFSVKKIKEYIDTFFHKGSELRDLLMEFLKEQEDGQKHKLLEFIDRILGNRKQHGVIGDYWEKVRDYFRDLNIEMKEEYARFGKWVKDEYERYLEKGHTKVENLRRIAEEFLRDGRTISKHMAVEAKFFFQEYSKEIGDMYKDVMHKILNVLESKKEAHGVIGDYWEKVRDYFRDLNIEMKEEYAKFGKWVKDEYERYLEKGHTRSENLRRIAEEFLRDARTLTKHMAVEAKFFFQEYSKEIGDMYKDVMHKILNVLESKKEAHGVIGDYWKKVKDYFHDLNIEMKEEYARFAKWVKDEYEQHLDMGKSKAENLRRIAEEFLRDSRHLSKHIAVEAKFFFEEYKNELGDMYKDVMNKIIDVLENGEESHGVIADYWQKVRDYFRDLNIEMKEEYARFGKWVKDEYERYLEKGHTRSENLRRIAEEFLRDGRTLTKHMAVEAKFFFQEYSKEIGDMYKDVMHKILNVLESKKEAHGVIGDYWKKVKDYFHDLKIEMKEEYARFAKWVKDEYEQHLDMGKSKAENLRRIAEEFLRDSRHLSKHIAVEAKFFFEEYKNELGDMYKDVMNKIIDVLENGEESHGVIADYWEKVRDYFRDLNIEMKEEYSKFGKWVKDEYERYLEKGHTKTENLKRIAEEFLRDSSHLSKHIAVEAKFFFHEYKNEIGDLFKDVMKKISNVLDRKDISYGVVADYWEKVRDYFRDLNIEMKEEYARFGKWVKDEYERYLEKGHTRSENLRRIAEEFLRDSRTLTKHMAVEAKFFFQEYSKEIGSMFKDVMKKISDTLNS